MEEEYVIGYQMQCKTCTAGAQQDKQLQGLKEVIEVDDDGDNDDDPDIPDRIMKPRSHFWATTNREYWSGVPHWQVPCACRTFVACLSARPLTRRFSSADPVGIPHFLKKCALSRDLFDIIIEMRPSVPSATLQNHIRRMSAHLLHQLLSPPSRDMTELHLFTYERRHLEYLNVGHISAMFKPSRTPFSTPFAADGYNDQSVSDETITEAYQHFVEMTRQRESEDFCKSLSGVCWD